MNDLIKLVKLQQLWTTSAYDSLIQNKILACLQDLRVIGVTGVNVDTFRSGRSLAKKVVRDAQPLGFMLAGLGIAPFGIT